MSEHCNCHPVRTVVSELETQLADEKHHHTMDLASRDTEIATLKHQLSEARAELAVNESIRNLDLHRKWAKYKRLCEQLKKALGVCHEKLTFYTGAYAGGRHIADCLKVAAEALAAYDAATRTDKLTEAEQLYSGQCCHRIPMGQSCGKCNRGSAFDAATKGDA